MTPSLRLTFAAALAFTPACKFPYPADVPDDDTPVDAHVRPQPLVRTNQSAYVVVGQPDFSVIESPPIGPRYLANVDGMGGGVDRLWVSQSAPSRVVSFEPLPTSNNPAGTLFLGRPDAFDNTENTSLTASNFGSPGAVADAGGHLLVVDSARRGVLVWSTVPTTGTTPADLVLGQPDFQSSAMGHGAGQLSSPEGVWSDGTRVVVSDSGNNRVLIWNTFPVRSAQPADLVLGQAALDQAVDPTSPTASNMKLPVAISSDGHHLAVVDFGFGRVLVWNEFPTTNGASADLAINVPDLHTVAMNTGGPQSLAVPTSLVVYDGALFIGDNLNDRVLVFDPIPSESVADVSRATQVLGQASPSVVEINQPRGPTTLERPQTMTVAGQTLFVSDMRRVLGFRLNTE